MTDSILVNSTIDMTKCCDKQDLDSDGIEMINFRNGAIEVSVTCVNCKETKILCGTLHGQL